MTLQEKGTPITCHQSHCTQIIGSPQYCLYVWLLITVNIIYMYELTQTVYIITDPFHEHKHCIALLIQTAFLTYIPLVVMSRVAFRNSISLTRKAYKKRLHLLNLVSRPSTPRFYLAADFSPRLRDKIWAWKAWIRGYHLLIDTIQMMIRFRVLQ